MIFLIKDINYYHQKLQESNNFFHLTNINKINVSMKNLQDIIENNLYKNIFLDMPLYLDFFKNINFNKFPGLHIYMYISNLSNISPILLIKSQIIMDKKDAYSNNYGEIEKFLNNKNYMINIPQEFQLATLRSYLIKVMNNMTNKDFLKKFLQEVHNIFFYTDRKIQFQMLYILNEEMKFYNNEN
jgi:hypothetical protein